MEKKSIAYLLVNFGGPRDLKEIEPFLRALLTDKDVVRTNIPPPLNRYLFNRVAKKRAKLIAKDYEIIGGGSPIFEDTIAVAELLEKKLKKPVLTFHRYLEATHKPLFDALKTIDADEIHVFPFFPQFSYATTGSIARLFSKELPEEVLHKLLWVKSYPSMGPFIKLFQKLIREFLEEKQLQEEEVILLFSAHGIPKQFVEEGDLYEIECEASFTKIIEAFPHALCKLSYQSKFGPGEWLRPYTDEECDKILSWNQGRRNVVVVPLTFTSDHIETLFEIEQLYLPSIRREGLNAYRVPAFNRHPDWIKAIAAILHDFTPLHTDMLVRRER